MKRIDAVKADMVAAESSGSAATSEVLAAPASAGGGSSAASLVSGVPLDRASASGLDTTSGTPHTHDLVIEHDADVDRVTFVGGAGCLLCRSTAENRARITFVGVTR